MSQRDFYHLLPIKEPSLYITFNIVGSIYMVERVNNTVQLSISYTADNKAKYGYVYGKTYSEVWKCQEMCSRETPKI